MSLAVRRVDVGMNVVVADPSRVGRQTAVRFGVVVVPRAAAEMVLRQSEARERKQAQTRERLQAGELGLDMYGMHDKLAQKRPACRPAEAEG